MNPHTSLQALGVYLAQDRRQALAEGRALPERTVGAALLADISGFTTLADSLTTQFGPRRGAEELTQHLNRVYDTLIGEVERFEGSVVGFAGDGVLCWFDADSGARATACALAMQRPIRDLSLKIAVATGPIRRFLVGDPSIQYLDVLAGSTLDYLARAEAQARRGEVLLTEATTQALGQALQVVEWRSDPMTGQRVAVVSDLSIQPAPHAPLPGVSALDPAVLRPWLLPAVYRRLVSGQGEFLTDLRPAAALFLHFSGIEYDADDAAGEKLNQFVCWVQQTLARYGGTLLDVVIGDKGSYLYAIFGAPIAHEDDTLRAALAARDLRKAPDALPFLRSVRLGLSRGTMRAGAYGGATRRTYGALGDEVNVAARLMEHAAPGEVLASGRVQAITSGHFAWEPLPPLTLKGKREPLPVFRLGQQARIRAAGVYVPAPTQPLIGREREVAQIEEKMALAARGHGQIVGIRAEAGMGKSRLATELLRRAAARGLESYVGECHSYGITTPYLVWQPIWRALFRLDSGSPPEMQVESLASEIAQLDPTLAPRLPLLGTLLNLPIPPTALTESMDPQLRKLSCEAMLVSCLRAIVARHPAPLLLVLEDTHWLDPLSHDLLEVLGRAVALLPVMLVILYRPPDPHLGQPLRVRSLPHFTEIALHELPPSEAEMLIRARLAALAGNPEIPHAPAPSLLARLVERSGGNPFYIEELVNYLHDQGISLDEPHLLDEMELPSSLHSLILSRMDQLRERQQVTLKVASIIGRIFRLSWLLGYYPALGDARAIRGELEALARLDLTPMESPEPEPIYLFKHMVTQEVAYESMPHQMRALLHEQLAHYLEAQGTLGHYAGLPLLDLLAYHYGKSENLDKKRAYLRQAGEAAQAVYANEVALSYYEQLLHLLPAEATEERYDLLARLADVLELIGRWEEAERYYRTLLDILPATQPVERARVALQLGSLLCKRGEHEHALTWLEQARAGWNALATTREGAAGLSQVLSEMAFVYYRQGDVEQVRRYSEESLRLARAHQLKKEMGQALSRLGNVACDEGEYERARACYQESLTLARAVDFRRGINSAITNLAVVAYNQGDYATARPLQEESLQLAREMGNRQSIAISLTNLGLIALAQGDGAAARDYYCESLQLAREMGERQMIAYGLVGLAGVAALQATPEAAQQAAHLVAAAASLLTALGAVLEPEEGAVYDGAVRQAKALLEPTEFEAIWQAGQQQPLDEVLETVARQASFDESVKRKT